MSIDARFRKAYPGFVLNVDLQLPARGVTAFFGPSGSGKTTLLRCIAGLDHSTEGYLYVKGETWQDAKIFLPPHQRPIGYVFQESNLFPHLNVAGNLDFGARRTKGNARGRSDIIELLGIAQLLNRNVQDLSGGERQRVAIARALLAAPQLLLMDEPLAALDRERKREILPYLERLHDELDIPILYVSHAIDEVSRLADHLVLLEQGRAIANGPLGEIATQLDLPLAQDNDASVMIEATVGAHDRDYHLTRLDFPGGCVHAGLHPGPHELPLAHRARISIQARDVSIALTPVEDSSILNRLPAVIKAFADTRHPAHLLVRLDVGGTPLLARITRRSFDQLGLCEGQHVWAQIKTVALVE
ncbi:MAG: molybdenum ABC transporter ATP-binding protein [Georgfuchsia sp.]